MCKCDQVFVKNCFILFTGLIINTTLIHRVRVKWYLLAKSREITMTWEDSKEDSRKIQILAAV